MEKIKQKTKEVVLTLIPNITEDQLQDDIDIFSIGLDSINAMSLVLELQEAFSIQFEVSEIDIDNFRTIEDIVNLIKNH